MINLISPLRKEEIRFSKYNQKAIRYVQLLVLVVVVLGSIFGAALVYIDMKTKAVKAAVATDNATIAAAAPFMRNARDTSDRLLAVKAIGASQTRFSGLLEDLAKVLPQGVSIDSVTLTGDDTKPVRIAVTGASYNSLLALRNALAASARVSAVDLESISQDTGGYHGGVVIGFKKGQAK